MFSSLSSSALCLFTLWSLASAHIVITYPGSRGNNLHSNGSLDDSQGLAVGPNNSFPYGMQWLYPCGGMPITQNRTLWPVTGGALSVQPGWFPGHATAYIYINLGIGNLPPNMSFPMVPVFQITGPSKQAYPGSFCLPQVPLPAGISPQIGDNATIQVIETAVHGAALYSCVDITFADPMVVPLVNASNCQNSSDIGFQLVYATTSLGGASSLAMPSSFLISIPFITAFVWAVLL